MKPMSLPMVISRVVASLTVTGAMVALSPGCANRVAVEGVAGEEQCDNLDESQCLFPFPSDNFRVAGGPHGNAFKIDIGDKTPENVNTGEFLKKEIFFDQDGFPVFPQIAFHLEGVTLGGKDGAATLSSMDQSLSDKSPTQILDAETLERQPHWVEFDYLAEEKGAKVIQLRLAKALKPGRRYLVAIRGLMGADGAPVAATRGFAALRDNRKVALRGIDRRRDHFDKNVFPVLERAGLPRASLQLAWDFTTATKDNTTGRLRKMRDQLYAAIGDDGPEYTITKVEKPTDEYIDTILSGVAKVPSFVLPLPQPAAPRQIRLDANGQPFHEGFEQVPFRIQIPKSARERIARGEAAPVLQYGHGFLGSDDEANNGWLRSFAQDRGMLILSANMQGMDTSAGILWFLLLPRDISHIGRIGDEPLQGLMNHLALQRLIKGRLLREPALQVEGKPIFDPAKLYYHGNSQGGTQGAMVMAMSRDVQRGVLGVPGVSIGFILARASQWRELAGTIQKGYPDPYDFAAIMSLVQVGWNRGDCTNFADYISATPPADGTPKNVLLHVALEDSQVNNDVSRVLGRLLDAKLIQPAVEPVWGLTPSPAGISGQNGYVDFDYGVKPRQKTNAPASSETDTHGYPRKSKLAQEQAFRFFTTGRIEHTCGEGPCKLEKP
jgi:hypothetical protein